MARFPSIDSEGAFEAPEVQNSIKELVTGSTDGITVDTSVGTRVYVGDTMIHGDTGWRDIRDMWVDTNDPKYQPTRIEIRRVNDNVYARVTINADDNQFENTLRVFPQISGFRVDGNFDWIAGVSGSTNFTVGTLVTSGYFHARAIPAPFSSGSGIRFETSWPTSNPWPTSLPGLPA